MRVAGRRCRRDLPPLVGVAISRVQIRSADSSILSTIAGWWRKMVQLSEEEVPTYMAEDTIRVPVGADIRYIDEDAYYARLAHYLGARGTFRSNTG
jgi:hypothetical protein